MDVAQPDDYLGEAASAMAGAHVRMLPILVVCFSRPSGRVSKGASAMDVHRSKSIEYSKHGPSI